MNTDIHFSWYFVDRASHYNLFFFISNLIHCFSVYVQYLLSSFLYMFQASQAHHQEVQTVHAAYGILPLCRRLCLAAVEKELKLFLNGCTIKTSAKGENTIGCMYNLDLLMMGLWGLKHVEEKQMLYVDEKQCIKSEIKKIKLTLFVSLQKACHCDFPLHSDF